MSRDVDSAASPTNVPGLKAQDGAAMKIGGKLSRSLAIPNSPVFWGLALVVLPNFMVPHLVRPPLPQQAPVSPDLEPAIAHARPHALAYWAQAPDTPPQLLHSNLHVRACVGPYLLVKAWAQMSFEKP